MDRRSLTQVGNNSGARPTNDNSIKFEIQTKLAALKFKICFADHKESHDSVTVVMCAKFRWGR